MCEKEKLIQNVLETGNDRFRHLAVGIMGNTGIPDAKTNKAAISTKPNL